MMRPLLTLAAISGFIAVLLGAMGAHFLSPLMNEDGQKLFHTANLYHLIHSLALLGCCLLAPLTNNTRTATRLLWLSALSFVMGILLFSGILYYVAIFPGFSLHFLIPLGGLFYMVGWLTLIALARILKTL